MNRRERNGDRAGGLDSNSSAVQHEPRWLPSGQPQRLAQGPRQRQQRRLEPQLPQPGQGRFQGIAASRIIYCLESKVGNTVISTVELFNVEFGSFLFPKPKPIFLRISKNVITKRLECKAETFNFKLISRVTVWN